MGLNFIDTHTHLYDEAFDGDFHPTIAKIKEAGVGCCIFPAVDSSSYQRQHSCAEICQGFVYEAIGLHPTSVGENWKEELKFVEMMLEKRNGCGISSGPFVAVGEIGLDGYWSREYMEEQKVAFREQLLLARRYGLPVIVHLREAMEELFEVLDLLELTDLRGVFHAYSGSYETYCRLKRYGNIKVGIGGVVTYKNAGVAKVLEKIPLEDILLETDSPWLTPVPFRGKRNDSSNLRVIAEKIAQIKGVAVEEVAEVTSCNARELFGLKNK